MHESWSEDTYTRSFAMMVRLADDVRIRLASGDGVIERPGQEPLRLRGEGAQLQTLATLLRTPRPKYWLHNTLTQTYPESSVDRLLSTLLQETVLIPWRLSTQLAELHQLTRSTSDGPVASPLAETARMMREYAAETAIALPPAVVPTTSLAQALAMRRTIRQFSGQPMDIVALSTLLTLAIGLGPESAKAPSPLVLGGPPANRSYPSGGALYPVELLVYPLRVHTVGTQFYYYQVLSHRLAPYAPEQPLDALVDWMNGHPIAEANILLFLFVDFGRVSLSKYGEKSYSLALLEAGHLAQNILLVGTTLGLGGLPISGYDDQELSLAASLAFPHEALIYVLALGAPAQLGAA